MQTITGKGRSETVTDYEAQCLKAGFLIAADGTFPDEEPVGTGVVGRWELIDRCLAAVRAKVAARLEELRAEIRAERISYGEISELQDLAENIDPGDVELLEWAGVPEYDEPTGMQDERANIEAAERERRAAETGLYE